MKKIIPVAICLFCFSKLVESQSLHFGLKAGANLQKIDGIPFKDKFAFGYQAGVFAAIGITPKIGIVIGRNPTQKSVTTKACMPQNVSDHCAHCRLTMCARYADIERTFC